MSHRHRIIFVAVALALLGSSGAIAQKKIYCWNENGKKVCGDALPAEAADSARREISTKSGMQTGQVGRALTAEEKAAAAAGAEQARLLAEAEAVRQRRDLAMVESYMTEADLRRAYGERIILLDETLKASQLGLSNLRLSLLGLLRQAGDKELASEAVPKSLADNIQRQHAELLRQQQILAAQRKDRAELDTELNDAVTRYRALKTPGVDASAPATTMPTPAG